MKNIQRVHHPQNYLEILKIGRDVVNKRVKKFLLKNKNTTLGMMVHFNLKLFPY
jgi:hypothetical protein